MAVALDGKVAAGRLSAGPKSAGAGKLVSPGKLG
jgi:hypothetical protein